MSYLGYKLPAVMFMQKEQSRKRFLLAQPVIIFLKTETAAPPEWLPGKGQLPIWGTKGETFQALIGMEKVPHHWQLRILTIL